MWRDQRIAHLVSVLALAGSLVPIACSPRVAGTTLHDLAEQYVRVTLQIAQHSPTLVDAWTGPANWNPGPRVPVAELRAAVDRLVAQTEALRKERLDPTDAPRVAYLQGQLRALSMISRRLLGETTSFSEEARAVLGRPLADVDQPSVARSRVELDRQLEGEGPLEERYAAFRRRFVVDGSRIERVVRDAIGICREATATHVLLPGDQRIQLSFDEGVEWDAVARYDGNHQTRVTVGVHGRDVAALLRMACHETYAGHHTQHVLIDDALVRGRRWLEFHLSPAFGPHRLISEGAAEAGVDLALPEDARARVYRERLLPLAGLPDEDAERLARVETLALSLDTTVPNVVARYLDNEASAADTVTRLATDALLLSPEAFLAFAERHRTSAVVYPIGRAAVSEWVARGASIEERWRRLQDLFTRTPFALN